LGATTLLVTCSNTVIVIARVWEEKVTRTIGLVGVLQLQEINHQQDDASGRYGDTFNLYSKHFLSLLVKKELFIFAIKKKIWYFKKTSRPFGSIFWNLQRLLVYDDNYIKSL
jgi:hypothetical protein